MPSGSGASRGIMLCSSTLRQTAAIFLPLLSSARILFVKGRLVTGRLQPTNPLPMMSSANGVSSCSTTLMLRSEVGWRSSLNILRMGTYLTCHLCSVGCGNTSTLSCLTPMRASSHSVPMGRGLARAPCSSPRPTCPPLSWTVTDHVLMWFVVAVTTSVLSLLVVNVDLGKFV